MNLYNRAARPQLGHNPQSDDNDFQAAVKQNHRHFPLRTQHPQPYPQNYGLAASVFYFTLNRLEKYLERYFTRYYDFYVEAGRLEEAKAVSNEAVTQLASELNTQHGMEQAAVVILCNQYSRLSLPQSMEARDKLKAWAEYLYAHLDPTAVPSTSQQRYEQELMDQAHATAADLWLTFRAFNKDPVKWGNEWATQQALKVYEQLEQLGNAAHRQWLLENQPHRVPPAKPIARLRPEAKEFVFVSRGPPTQSIGQSSMGNLSPATVNSDKTDNKYENSLMSKFSEEQPSAKKPEDKSIDPPSASAKSSPEVEKVIKNDIPQEVHHFLIKEEVTKYPCSEAEKSGNDELIRKASSPSLESRTHSRRSSIDSKQSFNRTIIMFSDVRNIPVEAVFDTGAEGGNWASEELVRQLSLESSIRECPSPNSKSNFLDASGRPIRGSHYVDLSWQWFSKNRYQYKKWHTTKFYILPSNHIQVLFGTDYIRDNNLIHFNDDATLAPLTANQPITLSTAKLMADNKRARDSKRAASNAKITDHTKLTCGLETSHDNLKYDKVLHRPIDFQGNTARSKPAVNGLSSGTMAIKTEQSTRMLKQSTRSLAARLTSIDSRSKQTPKTKSASRSVGNAVKSTTKANDCWPA